MRFDAFGDSAQSRSHAIGVRFSAGSLTSRPLDAGNFCRVDPSDHGVGGEPTRPSAAPRRRSVRSCAGAGKTMRRSRSCWSNAVMIVEPLSVDIASLVARSSKSRRSAPRAWPQSKMLDGFAKMLAASRVSARIVLKNLPWRADLSGEELNQRRRRLRFRAAVQTLDI